MSDRRDTGRLLPAPIRRLPADLAAIILLVLVTVVVVFTPGVRETPLRPVVGLLFVLFVPGYALVAALFPRAGGRIAPDETVSGATATVAREGPGRIDWLERVVFAVGTSIAIVAALGLVLAVSPWAFGLGPIVGAVSAVSLLAAAVGAARRRRVPEAERFRMAVPAWLTGEWGLRRPETTTDAVLDGLVVVSVLLAVGSVGYVVAGPSQDGATEFAVLNETDAGSLVVSDYPTNFTMGASRPLVVAVTNHEHERVNYTVVVLLEAVTIRDGESQVVERDRIASFQPTLEAGETWRQPHAVTPSFPGENLRLTYLLYHGTSPATPTVDNAAQELHLWINVSG